MSSFFSFISNTFTAIGAFFVGIAMAVTSFFIPAQPVVVATSTPVTIVNVATTSPSTAPVVVPPPVSPKPVPPPVVPPPITPPPPNGTIGTTTLAVQSIPLLSGGEVRGGKTVPISYLQITNVGTEGALLKGFWLKQNGGTATEEAVIGLKTVDDRGGSRGSVGGNEGDILFRNGVAFAPTDAYFAPGQMRLFTIKAVITRDATPYIGMQLTLVVTAIESAATAQAVFPIAGTTWTIAN